MKTMMIAAVAMLATAGPALAEKQSCANVTPAQIEAQFAKFNGAFASKDPNKVTSLFTSDAVLLATVSNQPRTTPAEINDYFVGFLKASPIGTINTSTVKIGCNKAARVGTWTVGMTDPATGAKRDVRARYTFLYRLVDDEWKIDHLHSSMMPETSG